MALRIRKHEIGHPQKFNILRYLPSEMKLEVLGHIDSNDLKYASMACLFEDGNDIERPVWLVRKSCS